MSGFALDAQSVTMKFGGLRAVSDFTIQVPSRSIFGLIGPNGAGKTTLFNVLTGIYQPTSGTVSAFGKNINGKKPYQITKFGLARTFQNIRLFKELTVLENIMIAMDNDSSLAHHSMLAMLFKTRGATATETAQVSRARKLLEALHLTHRESELARNLPYGEQRRLEIARALATGARLLLLDEPAAGMNSAETADLMAMIRNLRDAHDATILLIEHDMRLVMDVCERIAVLDYGVKIAEGTPREIQRHPQVIEAYLGKAASHD